MFYSGYMGWSLYGALSVFNMMYYFDIYKRQYMDNFKVNNMFDNMAFFSVFGASNYIRLHISMVVWFVMTLGWSLSTLGWIYPHLHTFFYGLTEVLMVIWIARTLLLLFMQVIGLIIDHHEKSFGIYDYYQQIATGAEMHIGDLYDAVDIELEAFNILVQVVAFGLYTIGQPIFEA